MLTHGLPKGYLDTHRLEREFLLKEILPVRPRLVVFGHIHSEYGKEIVRFDRVQKAYEGYNGVRLGERGIAAVIWMGLLVLMQRLLDLVPSWNLKEKIDAIMLVNVVAIGGFKN